MAAAAEVPEPDAVEAGVLLDAPDAADAEAAEVPLPVAEGEVPDLAAA